MLCSLHVMQGSFLFWFPNRKNIAQASMAARDPPCRRQNVPVGCPGWFGKQLVLLEPPACRPSACMASFPWSLPRSKRSSRRLWPALQRAARAAAPSSSPSPCTPATPSPADTPSSSCRRPPRKCSRLGSTRCGRWAGASHRWMMVPQAAPCPQAPQAPCPRDAAVAVCRRQPSRGQT